MKIIHIHQTQNLSNVQIVCHHCDHPIQLLESNITLAYRDNENLVNLIDRQQIHRKICSQSLGKPCVMEILV